MLDRAVGIIFAEGLCRAPVLHLLVWIAVLSGFDKAVLMRTCVTVAWISLAS